MWLEFRRGAVFTVVTMVLFGGAYPLAVWGIGRVAFPRQAEGSLLRRAGGTVIGSSLIAQNFGRHAYFHPRPSAVDYNGASTSGSNYGPSNADHLRLVRQRLDATTATDGIAPQSVPSELVTASGSGLDPHLPPRAADLQVARIAQARHVPPDDVRAIVQAHTEPPLWNVFGRARVNVLELNIALDERFGPAK